MSCRFRWFGVKSPREQRFFLTAKSVGTGPDAEDHADVIFRYPSDIDDFGGFILSSGFPVMFTSGCDT